MTAAVTAHPADPHERLRSVVRDFARTWIAPHVTRLEQDQTVEHDLPRLIAAQGWIGATIDPAYGGMGAGHEAKTVIVEEISRVSAAMGAAAQASQLGLAKIIHFGTVEQQREWLPRIADGTVLPTIAVTEPGSGGHVLGMQATGRRKGRDYVLTGRKVFVGNSAIGDVHGVVVRTGKGSKGLTAFLVESGRTGLTVSPHRPALGLHGFSFGELVLDECRVPAANMIGEPGDGLAVAYSSSTLYGRPNLTAVALGLHQAIYDTTTEFARSRTRYGKPLAKLPTIRAKLGELRSHLLTARTLAYHAVRLLDAGRPCDDDLINAKHVTTELLQDSARTAMNIWAAAGLLTEHPVQRYVRDALHMFPPAGTGDIQLLRLGETASGVTHPQWSARFPGTAHTHPDVRSAPAA
ncbi:Acyl-CoA dehydrogenase [Actinacidiphila alni]|uniref:Acyl-CoA dehydrogenase n=1 Tax=Actinacidiphila alni TaxID=380248 RepID=A0A1I2L9K8_9ACTN|nr:acyl-CoA dehydrogenase family protein [Actinacidiphila alni]SFF75139.1 Acyl-CoA dehydrogenase [Actinacidiphila alni]